MDLDEPITASPNEDDEDEDDEEVNFVEHWHSIIWLINISLISIYIFYWNSRVNQAQLQKTVLESENHEKIKQIQRV